MPLLYMLREPEKGILPGTVSCIIAYVHVFCDFTYSGAYTFIGLNIERISSDYSDNQCAIFLESINTYAMCLRRKDIT